MRPDVEIRVHGRGVLPGLWRERLSSLRITDEAGIQSDQLDMTLDNKGDIFELPRTGVSLDVSLSAGGDMVNKGRFTVDSVSTTYPVKTLRISARAADMLSSLKVRKRRGWFNLTLGEMIKEIAAEHDLRARVAERYSSIDIAPPPYAQIDQANESDLNFLTRLARRYDAYFKFQEGTLFFLERGSGRNAGGEVAPSVTLTGPEITNATVRASERGQYQSVMARYRDKASERELSVVAGSGDPVLTLRRIYPDQDSAQRAASGRLDSIDRGKASLSVRMPGRPEVMAETTLIMSVPDQLMAGEWNIKRVTHSLSGATAFTTEIEAESKVSSG